MRAANQTDPFRIGDHEIDIIVHGFPGKSVCHGTLGFSTIVLVRHEHRAALVDVGLTKGFALAERAHEIAKEIGNLTREALTQTMLGFIRVMHGDWVAAIAPFDRTVEISRQPRGGGGGGMTFAGTRPGYKPSPKSCEYSQINPAMRHGDRG